ncbi:MAG: murein biosynthesis integral membrane protein MurJ [Ruminococcaceae bacterium]|nr:murein biosynthesis integral membrane protein MurJ [Oscillospiraceae bacterium]
MKRYYVDKTFFFCYDTKGILWEGDAMQEEQKKRNIRTVGIMMALTLLGKVLGLARDMLLGRTFATGLEADAFMAASRIPRNFFDAIFASAISASFIPVFNEYLEKKGKDEAFRLSGAFITLMALLTAALSALGMLFAQPITTLLAKGFDAETSLLCARLLRLLFPTVFFTGLAFSLVGVLQSLGEFNIPALLSAVSNAVIILYYICMVDRFGVMGLAVAFLVGWGAQVLIQLPALHRFGYRYQPTLRHEGLHKIFLLAGPVLVSTWVQPLNLMIATRYASFIPGGASALEYANTLYTIVAGVFVLSIANVIFPELSRSAAREDDTAMGESISGTLGAMLFLLTPMAVGLAVLARPIVRLLYEWGAWDASSTDLTAGALAFLSAGMLGYGVQIILSRAFYAEQKGKTPLLAGTASVLANLALCALLAPALGLRGLALASAVALTVPALVLLIAVRRRYPGALTRAAAVDFGKMLFCSALMGISVHFARAALAERLSDTLTARAAAVFAPALLGVAVYFALVLLCRVSTVSQLRELLRGRRKHT